MSSKFAIKTTKLTRKFGKNMAVKSVNIRIKEGEIYGFLGPNGAGKSTTVKMLVGLLQPSSGSAEILGHSISDAKDDIRLYVGAALQEASLDGNQTGREVLELQGRLYGLTKSEVQERMADMAELVDIGAAIDSRIKTYSGGMKRRVDLAAALIHNPRVVFLDEPTTGLDPISRAKVWREIRNLNREKGVTIFLTTQYLEEADELADRVAIIDNGRIVAEDTPQNLKRKIGSDVIEIESQNIDQVWTSELENHLKKTKGIRSVGLQGNRLRLGVADTSVILKDVILMLDRNNISVDGLNIRQASLDDVFLKVTGAKTEVTNG